MSKGKLVRNTPSPRRRSSRGQVIITGATPGGIGATTALFYAKAGASVVLTARNIKDLEERKAVIEKEVPGAQVLVVAGDISAVDAGKGAVQAAVQKWGKIDIVVANPGLGQGGVESKRFKFDLELLSMC